MSDKPQKTERAESATEPDRGPYEAPALFDHGRVEKATGAEQFSNKVGSDRDSKEGFAPVDSGAVLDAVSRLSVAGKKPYASPALRDHGALERATAERDGFSNTISSDKNAKRNFAPVDADEVLAEAVEVRRATRRDYEAPELEDHGPLRQVTAEIDSSNLSDRDSKEGFAPVDRGAVLDAVSRGFVAAKKPYESPALRDHGALARATAERDGFSNTVSDRDAKMNRDGVDTQAVLARAIRVPLATKRPYTAPRLEDHGQISARTAEVDNFSNTIHSDRGAKAGFDDVDVQAILGKLSELPIETWDYKDGNDPGGRHMGPMAQDFAAAFGLGDDARRIQVSDALGVIFASIQALHQKLEARERELEELRQQVMALDQEPTPVG